MPKKTVRDFKKFVLKETGVETSGEFCQISDAHLSFWHMLNNLWTDLENPRPEDVKDVDAAIELSDDEWENLLKQFYNINIPKNIYKEECFVGRISSIDVFKQLVSSKKVKIGDYFHNFDFSGLYQHLKEGKIIKIHLENFRQGNCTYEAGIEYQTPDGKEWYSGYSLMVYREEEGVGFMPYIPKHIRADDPSL